MHQRTDFVIDTFFFVWHYTFKNNLDRYFNINGIKMVGYISHFGVGVKCSSMELYIKDSYWPYVINKCRQNLTLDTKDKIQCCSLPFTVFCFLATGSKYDTLPL